MWLLYCILYVIIGITIFCIIKNTVDLETDPDLYGEVDEFIILFCCSLWIIIIPIVMFMGLMYILYKAIDHVVSKIISLVFKEN